MIPPLGHYDAPKSVRRIVRCDEMGCSNRPVDEMISPANLGS